MDLLLGRIWAAWCLIWFAFTAMFLYPFFLILFHSRGRHSFSRAQNAVRWWTQALLKGFGMPLRKSRRDLYPRTPCILVSNHFSQLDILVIIALLPPKYHIISKHEVLRMPIVGGVLKRLHLTFNRSDPKSRAAIVLRMEEELARGYSIVVFPEGSRNRGPGLTRPFQRGAFELAAKTDTPVSVLTIIDTYRRNPAALGFAAFPGRVRCVFNEALQPSAFHSANELSATARRTIEYNLARIYGEHF